ncbi:MAG: hypothetical protein K2K40_06945 [Paramuribaculum sp.]|nr:hypothetical protein [Paramuribaculum sp.]
MMRLSLNTLTAAAVTLLASACSESAEPSLPEVDDEGMVYFTINVSSGSIGGSRADGDFSFDNGLSPYEQMQTLRAIIVRSTPDNPATDGLIEHNELIYNTNSNQGVNLSSSGFLKVIGGEKKNVYLFANENHTYPSPFTNNNLTPKLNNLTIGKKFPAEEFIGMEIEFPDGTTQQPIIDNETSRAKKYLPMSERFEITVDKLNDDASNRYQSADLFVTRAAVKYGFYIDEKSTSQSNIKITDITVHGLADREYLLPQNGTGVDATYAPDKYSVTKDDRIITAYTCPDDVETYDYTFTMPENFGILYDTDGKDIATKKYEPALYFAESPLPDDAKYCITVKTNNDYFTKPVIYGPISLPNLPNLPRNTFVKVILKLTDDELEVIVQPYTGVWLEPDFGIER